MVNGSEFGEYVLLEHDRHTGNVAELQHGSHAPTVSLQHDIDDSDLVFVDAKDATLPLLDETIAAVLRGIHTQSSPTRYMPTILEYLRSANNARKIVTQLCKSELYRRGYGSEQSTALHHFYLRQVAYRTTELYDNAALRKAATTYLQEFLTHKPLSGFLLQEPPEDALDIAAVFGNTYLYKVRTLETDASLGVKRAQTCSERRIREKHIKKNSVVFIQQGNVLEQIYRKRNTMQLQLVKELVFGFASSMIPAIRAAFYLRTTGFVSKLVEGTVHAISSETIGNLAQYQRKLEKSAKNFTETKNMLLQEQRTTHESSNADSVCLPQHVAGITDSITLLPQSLYDFFHRVSFVDNPNK